MQSHRRHTFQHLLFLFAQGEQHYDVQVLLLTLQFFQDSAREEFLLLSRALSEINSAHALEHADRVQAILLL